MREQGRTRREWIGGHRGRSQPDVAYFDMAKSFKKVLFSLSKAEGKVISQKMKKGGRFGT